MAKVTAAKVAANKANAQKSTGPRSAAGKARTRRNGLKHGLRAELVLVPTESADEWNKHREAVLKSIAPQNYVEELFADRAALAAWRLRRAAQFERALVTKEQLSANQQAEEDALKYDFNLGPVYMRTREAAEREHNKWAMAVRALELAEQPGNDNEDPGDDETWFWDLLEIAAKCAGISLETKTDDDGDAYQVFPEAVYGREEDARDYWPTIGELHTALAAVVSHNASEYSEDKLRKNIRHNTQYELDEAEKRLAKLNAATQSARDVKQLPVGSGESLDLFLRYESAAERTLSRSLESIVRIREGLGSVGKNEGGK